MWLAVATALAGVWLTAPHAAERLFGVAYRRERAAIAVDNAAILLGRGGRTGLRALALAERHLATLHRLHESVHRCAKLRLRAECAALDVAAEGAAATAVATAESVYRTAVFRAREAARRQLVGEGAGATLHLSEPTGVERCARCGSPLHWRWAQRLGGPEGLVLWRGAEGTELRRLFFSVVDGRWDYRLRYEPRPERY